MTPKALSREGKVVFGEERKFLVFTKQEWLMNPIIKWTEEEIDNADEYGFIGTRFEIDCYLARKLSTVLTKENK